MIVPIVSKGTIEMNIRQPIHYAAIYVICCTGLQSENYGRSIPQNTACKASRTKFKYFL
jgi:hypothetical protein